MKRTLLLGLVLVVATAPQAAARTTLRVHANHPATVYLDGDRIGTTPVTIPRLRGRHVVRMRSQLTGEERTRRVRAGGRKRTSTTTIRAHFAPSRRASWGSGYHRPYGYRTWDRRWEDGRRYRRGDRWD